MSGLRSAGSEDLELLIRSVLLRCSVRYGALGDDRPPLQSSARLQDYVFEGDLNERRTSRIGVSSED